METHIFHVKTWPQRFSRFLRLAGALSLLLALVAGCIPPRPSPLTSPLPPPPPSSPATPMLDPHVEIWMLRPVLPEGRQLSEDEQRAITQLLLRRANCLAERYEVSWQSDGQIAVMLNAVRTPDTVAKTLIGPGRLEFVRSDPPDLVMWPAEPGFYVRTNSNPNDPDPVIHGAPDDPFPDYTFQTILSGEHLKDAHPLLAPNANVSLALEFTDEGARILATYTEQHIGEVLAIVLDNIVLLMPQINASIPAGQALIDSNPEDPWTLDEATCITTMMNTTLPFPLEIVGSRSRSSMVKK